jgi:hypothetical protein
MHSAVSAATQSMLLLLASKRLSATIRSGHSSHEKVNNRSSIRTESTPTPNAGKYIVYY